LQLEGPGLYAPVINDLTQVSKDWPKLDGLHEMAERCADGMRRELWLAAARGDDVAMYLPKRQMKMLTDSGALSLETAQRFWSETETALAFGRKLRALKKENRQGEIATLTLPSAAEEITGAWEALTVQVAVARTALAAAGKELGGGSRGVRRGQFQRRGDATGEGNANVRGPSGGAGVQGPGDCRF
jgi:hypothetical protein